MGNLLPCCDKNVTLVNNSHETVKAKYICCNIPFKKQIVTHRPYIKLQNLKQFDLVLIRSKVTLNTINIDSTIGRGILFQSHDIKVTSAIYHPKYDHIGFIQIPSFVDPLEYNINNIKVTQCNFNGIKTLKLSEIIENS